MNKIVLLSFVYVIDKYVNLFKFVPVSMLIVLGNIRFKISEINILMLTKSSVTVLIEQLVVDLHVV